MLIKCLMLTIYSDRKIKIKIALTYFYNNVKMINVSAYKTVALSVECIYCDRE